eukprot:403333168
MMSLSKVPLNSQKSMEFFSEKQEMQSLLFFVSFLKSFQEKHQQMKNLQDTYNLFRAVIELMTNFIIEREKNFHSHENSIDNSELQISSQEPDL